MGKIVSQTSTLSHSDIGVVETVLSVIEDYDVEDMVRGKALSQARRVQWLVEGKRVDINSPTGPATISTPFFQNTEELLD